MPSLTPIFHQNPVRAKIVTDPRQYIWSGHSVYLDCSEISWLTTDYGLSKFEDIKEIVKERYQAYVMKQESQEELSELRKRFKDGQVLGDDNFLDQIRDVRELKKFNNFSLEIGN